MPWAEPSWTASTQAKEQKHDQTTRGHRSVDVNCRVLGGVRFEHDPRDGRRRWDLWGGTARRGAEHHGLLGPPIGGQRDRDPEYEPGPDSYRPQWPHALPIPPRKGWQDRLHRGMPARLAGLSVEQHRRRDGRNGNSRRYHAA